MKTQVSLASMSAVLLLAASANAQVLGGVMTVTGAEMHWWAGVAREATARLYDVDEDSVVFKKLNQTKKYDQGTVTFRARKDKLIDLDKLHESVWASRRAHGTRSGLVSLDVDVVGKVVQASDGLRLKVSNSDAEFVLAESGEKDLASVFGKLQACADAEPVVRLRGRIDKYKGRWPSLYRESLKKPRRILVFRFEEVE